MAAAVGTARAPVLRKRQRSEGRAAGPTTTKARPEPCLRCNAYFRSYQKNCARASRMFGSSLTKPRAVELYFLLSTIT